MLMIIGTICTINLQTEYFYHLKQFMAIYVEFYFIDPDCGFLATSPYGMSDWFDNHHEPSDVWRRIMGGKLGLGCGVVDYGNSLHFSGDGTREAVTVPLNTTYLRCVLSPR